MTCMAEANFLTEATDIIYESFRQQNSLQRFLAYWNIACFGVSGCFSLNLLTFFTSLSCSLLLIKESCLSLDGYQVK